MARLSPSQNLILEKLLLFNFYLDYFRFIWDVDVFVQ